MTADDRAAAIQRAGDCCEKCGWLAWSNERHAQLELRPRIVRGETVGQLVLCPSCTEKHDAKHQNPSAAA